MWHNNCSHYNESVCKCSFFRKMLSISCMTTHTLARNGVARKIWWNYPTCNSQWYGSWSDRKMCAWRTSQCMCALIYSSFGCCQCFLFIRPKFIVHTINFYWNASNSTWKISHHTNSIQCAYLCFFFSACLDNANRTIGRSNTQRSLGEYRKKSMMMANRSKLQFKKTKKLSGNFHFCENLNWCVCARRWQLLRLFFIIVLFGAVVVVLRFFFSFGNLLQTFQYLHIFVIFTLTVMAWREYEHFHAIRIFRFFVSVRVPILHSIRMITAFSSYNTFSA